MLLTVLHRLPAHRPVPREHRGRPPVTFLVWNLHAMGGTVRTVLRQASALADRGTDVTIVAVLRHSTQHRPFFTIDPRIRVELLADRVRLRGDGAAPAWRRPGEAVLRWLDRRPARLGLVSHGRADQASLATDLALVVRLARARGVVVGTRMGLNLAIARFAHPSTVRVAQEHLGLSRYPDPLRTAARRLLPGLDLVVCLTEGEAAAYRRLLRGRPAPQLAVVPNALPDRLPPPTDRRAQRIVSVGRLERGKGYLDLIDGFAALAPHAPGWTLRIVGEGRHRPALEARVAEHGLGDRIELPGATDRVADELAAASVFVSTSRFESFGLVLLEAMAVGLPVVAYAAPRGPRELISDGHDGLLVPPGRIAELTAALARCVDEVALRDRLGENARATARSYRVAEVTDRWDAVLGALVAPPDDDLPRLVELPEPAGTVGASEPVVPEVASTAPGPAAGRRGAH